MNFLFLILFSIALLGLFKIIETAFFSVGMIQLEMDKNKGMLFSKILNLYKKNPQFFMIVLLTGNLFSIVILSLSISLVLKPYFFLVLSSLFLRVAVQILIAGSAIFIFGRFVPIILGRLYPVVSIKILALPFLIFYVLFYPLILIYYEISKLILKYFLHLNLPESPDQLFGKVDLAYLVLENQTNSKNDLKREPEIKIFRNALSFSSIRLRDCMIPRTEITAIESGSSFDEIRERFIESGYSKILVYKDNIDNILGFLSSKELFKTRGDINSKIIPLPFVPETMLANKLLKQFIKDHKSMAVIIDEFGGVSGMLTIEDLIEEIIGEIEDEHDIPELTEQRFADNEFILSGRLEIDYLNEKYAIGLPKNEEYETLAGLIFYYHEQIPKKNERIEIPPFKIKILRVTPTRIELIHLKKNVD